MFLSDEWVGEVGLPSRPHQFVHVLSPPHYVRYHRQIHTEESVKRRIQISQNITQHRHWKYQCESYWRNSCFISLICRFKGIKVVLCFCFRVHIAFRKNIWNVVCSVLLSYLQCVQLEYQGQFCSANVFQ